jgi:diaminopimelate decarboxylase
MPIDIPLKYDELEALVDIYGTPLQLYDEYGIRLNMKKFTKTFTNLFPDFKNYYAVKALPNPAILQILISEGCGLDCSSKAELYIAKQLGLKSENIIFTSNYTSDDDLSYALDINAIINLDDISLLDYFKRYPAKVPEILSFRLNPNTGTTSSETKSNILGGSESKFGVPIFDIINAYQKAKELGIKRFGIHMMVGSCVMDTSYWKHSIELLYESINDIKTRLNIDFEFINIGGGIGINYRPEEAPIDLELLGQIIKDIISSCQVKYGLTRVPRLCMENGRYLTGAYGWLISKCHAIKKSYDDKIFYGLDACMVNLMRPGMYGSYHHITVPKYNPQSILVKSNVVGSLCENNDWFAKDRLLPIAQIGDLFVIHDTGAHSFSMGFNYNGKLKAIEVLIRSNGRTDIIRERQTIESLYIDTKIPTDLMKIRQI